MPYKHYEAQVIEDVLAAEEEQRLFTSSCPADNKTLLRWIKEFKERGTHAVGWLKAILFSLCQQHVSMLSFKGKGLLKQLAHLLMQFKTPKIGRVTSLVNSILTAANLGYI